MDKYKKAVGEYEKARQEATKLEKKRADLISGCTKHCETEFHSKYCLAKAYDDTKEMRKENNEYYTFDEVLSEGHASGDYCDNCYESYKLKNGDLAKARKAFGIAKRRLSSLGKKLLAT
jgi:hypothetical protein